MKKLPKFIFVHIVKTGGTSLKGMIKNLYKDKYIFDKTYNRKNKILTIKYKPYPKDYKSKSVIHGHFRFDRYEHLGWPMITFIRHPVSRMVSEYSRIQLRLKGQYELDIVSFARIHRSNLYGEVIGDVSKFAFIGIIEEYDKSIKKLEKVLGINLGPVKKSNVMPPKYTYQLSKAERKEIEIITKKDIDLYNTQKFLLNNKK